MDGGPFRPATQKSGQEFLMTRTWWRCRNADLSMRHSNRGAQNTL